MTFTSPARAVRLVAFVGILLLGLGGPAHAQRQDAGVAIVVHPDTRIDNLSFDELRRIFRGEQQFWSPGGSRITLLVRAPVAHERNVVLNKIYQMSETRFRQHWIQKMFRAEVAAGPKIVYSTDMTRELVTVIPGAIGFMPASAAAGLKIVRIDNRLPGDPDYKLR